MSKVLWKPNPGPQTAFLRSAAREVLYGGAAGGGKSDALLAAPLRWVDRPAFAGVVLRRTRNELQEIIDRGKELYSQVCRPKPRWVEQRNRWEFPSGAIIRAGYAEHEDDILRFQSDEYQYIAFDESTSFTKKQINYMRSRNRTTDPEIPLHIRYATNPGDISHQFFLDRFVAGREPYRIYEEEVELPTGETLTTTRQFIPATVFDNPKLENREEYIAGMQSMGEDLVAALLWGRWDVFEGQFFTALPKPISPFQCSENRHYTIRCLDYGWNDPTAVYWIVVDRKSKTLTVTGELYVSQVPLEDLARMILEKQSELFDAYGVPKPMLSVADPSIFARESTSEQSVGSLLQQHGVWFEKANNDRVSGWSYMKSLLQKKKLRVFENTAPQLMRTLPTLQYDPKKRDDVKKSGQVEDHAADALRYGLMAYYEQEPPKPKPKPKDPLRQDTFYPKLQKRLQKQARRFDSFEGLGGGW